jgi:hypothetical protein
MKRIALVIMLVFLTVGLFAQNRFIGKWEITVFANEDTGVFEFLEDGRLLIYEDGDLEEESGYILDAQNRLLTIQAEEGMVFRYSFEGNDEFGLFLFGDFLEMMAGSFTNGMGSAQNELTLEITEELRKAFVDVFTRYPLMRGTRLPKE